MGHSNPKKEGGKDRKTTARATGKKSKRVKRSERGSVDELLQKNPVIEWMNSHILTVLADKREVHFGPPNEHSFLGHLKYLRGRRIHFEAENGVRFGATLLETP